MNPVFFLFSFNSDGAGRTGTFLAISILLDRLNVEQLIDVFQTIKKIRVFRPEFVENAVSLSVSI